MDEHLIQLHVEDPNEAVMLLGISDQNMKLIEEALNISVVTRGDTISLSGEEKNRDSAKESFGTAVESNTERYQY